MTFNLRFHRIILKKITGAQERHIDSATIVEKDWFHELTEKLKQLIISSIRIQCSAHSGKQIEASVLRRVSRFV